MRYLFIFVGLVTLTAIGQSTLTQTWYHPPCKAGDQQGAGITGPDAPKWQDEKTGLWCIHIVQPKKHKAPVKPARDMTPPIDDGVAHWQAPKRPTVPEDIKDGPICDNLPETQQITCLMNLLAPEKAVVPEPDPIKTAQDNYDVPPINEEYGTLGFQWCDMGQCVWEDYDPNSALQKALGNKPHRRMRFTCADKTRFLITSEDSKVHCIAIREPK